MKKEKQSTLFPAESSSFTPKADVKILHTDAGGLVVSLGIDASEETTKIVSSFLSSPQEASEVDEKRRIERFIEDLRRAGAKVEQSWHNKKQ